MNSPALATLLVVSSLLVAAAAPPPVPPVKSPAPANDYTTQASEPALVPEYNPADAPQPMYASPPGDEGGLRQCVGADGVPIFTDRRCSDLQATPVQPRSQASAGAVLSPGQQVRRTCARNQDDLLAGVRAALESHDANRLADFYHWTGMGTAEGYRLMDRLDAFSSRPVVDVRLVRSAPPDFDPYADPYDGSDPAPPPPVALIFGGDGQPADAPPPAPRTRLAHLLRVDQMRSDRDVGASITYFHLLTNAGCWWMRF